MRLAIDDIPHLDIREAAIVDGLDHVTVRADNGKTGDARVVVYEVGAVLVAGTNGNSVWQDNDVAAFAALLTDEGIELGRAIRNGYRPHDGVTEWQECDTCHLRLGAGIETKYDAVYYTGDPSSCPRCEDGIMALPDPDHRTTGGAGRRPGNEGIELCPVCGMELDEEDRCPMGEDWRHVAARREED